MYKSICNLLSSARSFHLHCSVTCSAVASTAKPSVSSSDTKSYRDFDTSFVGGYPAPVCQDRHHFLSVLHGHFQDFRCSVHNTLTSSNVNPPSFVFKGNINSSLHCMSHNHAVSLQMKQSRIDHLLRFGILGWLISRIRIITHPYWTFFSGSSSQYTGHGARTNLSAFVNISH